MKLFEIIKKYKNDIIDFLYVSLLAFLVVGVLFLFAYKATELHFTKKVMSNSIPSTMYCLVDGSDQWTPYYSRGGFVSVIGQNTRVRSYYYVSVFDGKLKTLYKAECKKFI